jgi:hypothetical protein
MRTAGTSAPTVESRFPGRTTVRKFDGCGAFCCEECCFGCEVASREIDPDYDYEESEEEEE